MAMATFFDYPSEHGGSPTGHPADVLLPALDDAGWRALLGFMEVSRYAGGEVVLPAGAEDRSLYLVADGVLEIAEADGPIAVEAGGILGELSFFDGQRYRADVRARSDVDLYSLSPEAFEVMAAREPVLARTLLLDLGRILAGRLRRASAPALPTAKRSTA